jgi:hypothetical protein
MKNYKWYKDSAVIYIMIVHTIIIGAVVFYG